MPSGMKPEGFLCIARKNKIGKSLLALPILFKISENIQ